MTDHNSYTTSVTFADQIELNEQPMLESQPRSTTTTNAETITARDVFNCILTTNVKRAVLLLVPTLCVIYIWWQHYDAGLDYVCSRDPQTITIQLVDEHQTNEGDGIKHSTAATDAALGNDTVAADPLQVYLANQKKAQGELQARLDAIDWTPYEQAAAADAPMSNELIRQYWQAVAPYFDSRPYAPLMVTERPEPLPTPPDCKTHRFFQEGVLTGELRATPARIFDVFTMSYEVDVAEMRMFELDGLVDKFVVSESSRSHRGTYKSLALARNEERYKRFGEKIIHLLNDEADLQAMIPDPSQVANGDHWSIDMGQRRIAVHKLHDLVGGFQENDLLIAGDLDEIPYAEAINILKYCEPVLAKFPVSLGSEHSYRFNFNYILSRYHIDVPYVIPGSLANELVAQGSDFRASGISMATHLSPFSTHCTTFGDIMTDVVKLISISEARDKVPANQVMILSRPFDREPDTIALGIGPFEDRHGENDRTIDRGWVGPIMCRKEFIEKYGEAALPRIPWVALANPASYHMYLGPMSECIPL